MSVRVSNPHCLAGAAFARRLSHRPDYATNMLGYPDESLEGAGVALLRTHAMRSGIPKHRLESALATGDSGDAQLDRVLLGTPRGQLRDGWIDSERVFDLGPFQHAFHDPPLFAMLKRAMEAAVRESVTPDYHMEADGRPVRCWFVELGRGRHPLARAIAAVNAAILRDRTSPILAECRVFGSASHRAYHLRVMLPGSAADACVLVERSPESCGRGIFEEAAYQIFLKTWSPQLSLSCGTLAQGSELLTALERSRSLPRLWGAAEHSLALH